MKIWEPKPPGTLWVTPTALPLPLLLDVFEHRTVPPGAWSLITSRMLFLSLSCSKQQLEAVKVFGG